MNSDGNTQEENKGLAVEWAFRIDGRFGDRSYVYGDDEATCRKDAKALSGTVIRRTVTDWENA